MALMASTRREVDIPNYPLWLMILAPLAALALQSMISLHFPKFDYLDLPLLVAIYFGITWRHPVGGALFGTAIGILQDAVTQHPLGVFGIAKSIVGYMAASIGIRIDTESYLTRLLLIPGFTLLQSAIVWLLEKRLIEQPYAWIWTHEILRAAVTAVAGLLLFGLLDMTRRRD
jgi:rod shape-determining protein MreD